MIATQARKLIELKDDYGLRVEAIESWNEDLFLVRFHSKSSSWEVYIEDEYQDFNPKNQLVSIYLVLRALEDFKIEENFLKWCAYYAIDASDHKWLEYYRQLTKMLVEIEAIIGTIDPFIASMDYDLREGAFADLLKAESD